MASKVKFSRVLYGSLNSVPITDGQITYTKDTNDLFLDTGSDRHKITDMIYLADVQARDSLGLTAFTNKIYYIASIKEIQRWDGTAWQKLIADSTANRVTFNNIISGMAAVNIQDAIDELDARLDDAAASKMNLVNDATANNIATYGINGQVKDSGISLSDITSDITDAVLDHDTSETAHTFIQNKITNLDFVKDVIYDSGTGDLSFVMRDDSSVDVNISQPELNVSFDESYDFGGEVGPALVFNEGTPNEFAVPLGDLVPTFTGETGANIKVTVTGGLIGATLLAGTITKTQLTTALQNELDDKLGKLTTYTAGNILVATGDGRLSDSGVSLANLENDAEDNIALHDVDEDAHPFILRELDDLDSAKVDRQQVVGDANKYLKVGPDGVIMNANLTAPEVAFDNSISNLTSTNVKAAIDELKVRIDSAAQDWFEY